MDVRTTKPISTISYNTVPYLKLKLDELKSSGRISFYAFINHKPEDDEAGKKFHNHVYMVPSKMLQTEDVRKFLEEFDPSHPNKPLGALEFNSSKFDDWYLYALHNKPYLASKSHSRVYSYVHSDIITDDEDNLLCKARMIDKTAVMPYAVMLDYIAQGLTFDEYFRMGNVPIPQIRAFKEAWFCLTQSCTDRNGRKTHTPIVDEDTGEVNE